MSPHGTSLRSIPEVPGVKQTWKAPSRGSDTHNPHRPVHTAPQSASTPPSRLPWSQPHSDKSSFLVSLFTHPLKLPGPQYLLFSLKSSGIRCYIISDMHKNTVYPELSY